MFAFIIIIAALAAIAATGKQLPEILLSPAKNLIHKLGLEVEGLSNKMREYVINDPPNPISYILCLLSLIGALSWIAFDSMYLSLGFQILLPEKMLGLLSFGNRSVGLVMSKYLYWGISLSCTLVLSMLVHHSYEYLAYRYPERINGIVAVMNIITVVSLLVVLGMLRYQSTKIGNIINNAIMNKDYSVMTRHSTDGRMLGVWLYVLGVIASGHLWFLGYSKFIKQNSQMIVGVLGIPVFFLCYMLMAGMIVFDGTQRILEVPVAIVDGILSFLKWLFRKKPPMGPGTFTSAILLFGLSLLFSGCSIPDARPRLFVTVIDLSSSFKPERENTIAKVNELIDNLEPEDQFYCLFVDGNSFSNKRLLYLRPEDAETDVNAKLVYFKSKDDLKKQITDVVNKSSATRTDILGSFQRTQELFKEKGMGHDRYLIVFSDMDDNINNRSSQLMLDSVRVLILFAGTNQSNFNASQSNIERWREILQESHVSSPEIYSHDISVSLDINKYLNEGK